MKSPKRSLLLIAVIVVAAVWTTSAFAAYWDYQGNLPTAGGSPIYVKFTNAGPPWPGEQRIRMSWTYGSHYMRVLKIYPSGTWEYRDVHGADPNECQGADFDCWYSNIASDPSEKFGCYNPPALGTVWVNCRATNPVP